MKMPQEKKYHSATHHSGGKADPSYLSARFWPKRCQKSKGTLQEYERLLFAACESRFCHLLSFENYLSGNFLVFDYKSHRERRSSNTVDCLTVILIHINAHAFECNRLYNTCDAPLPTFFFWSPLVLRLFPAR